MSRFEQIDLWMMKIFCEVAETGNLTRVAENLNISQPAVSGTIKKIEKIVGTPVFNRNSRPLVKTLAGELLYSRASEILDLNARLQQDLQSLQKGRKPDVRIGTTISFSDTVNAFLVPRLMQINMADNISLSVQSTYQINAQLQNGKLDIAITCDSASNLMGVDSRLLFSEDYLIVVPKKSAGSADSSARADQIIHSLPYLHFDRRSFDYAQTDRYYRRLCDASGRRQEVDNYHTLFGLISSGFGWSIVPPLSIWIGRQFKSSIECLPSNSFSGRRSFYVLRNKDISVDFFNIVYAESRRVIENQILSDMKQSMPDLVPFLHFPRTDLVRNNKFTH